jgi:hypothetical protein
MPYLRDDQAISALNGIYPAGRRFTQVNGVRRGKSGCLASWLSIAQARTSLVWPTCPGLPARRPDLPAREESVIYVTPVLRKTCHAASIYGTLVL